MYVHMRVHMHVHMRMHMHVYMRMQVSQLKQTFEDRLNEAVEKVRAVHATNRDAVAILQRNKKLKLEVWHSSSTPT